MKVIGIGAEAIIYLDGNVTKDRVTKGYRLPVIDERLRKSRTKREAKVLTTLAKQGIPAPKLLNSDDKQRIEMEFISGPKIRDILEKSEHEILCAEIGKKVALMHNAGIIHGDLTTSNMIMREEIYLIDFGLSFFSEKVEDKAVDLHLFKQALESKHYTIWERCYRTALKGYSSEAKGAEEILKRLEQVEKRGRYKHKG